MFTYDFNAAPTLSQIRLMVADTDPTRPIFQDDEVLASISVEGGTFTSAMAFSGAGSRSFVATPASVRRCAALLLDALAANKARLAGVMAVLDVKLGVDKAAQELRATAKCLRETEADSGSFAIAEQAVDSFAMRERVIKQLFRLSPN